ncbi:histidine phosphatase family protein [Psychrobacter sp. 16-MNA-CIBAN-0192]|uniref:histidine phosphatase family protein n=1 Tax=Psychrobacter sp. 16-MNA-CIBAN-0192 TaxID=3140448 RepID=UPI0033347249
MTTLYIWRHPKPLASAGICLGHTDMGVDRRKLKRLAHHIERFVRVYQLPKVIWVSPLQRSFKVGQLLIQRGFICHVAPELTEINFGAWDGQSWEKISKEDIDTWCDNFADFTPDNGESLQQLFERVATWLSTHNTEKNDLLTVSKSSSILAVGHAGWITAAKMIAAGNPVPQLATEWSAPVAYNQLSIFKYARNV